MPEGRGGAEVDDVAGEDHVLDLQGGGVGRGPPGDLPAQRGVVPDHDVDGVCLAAGVGVVVRALDVAAEIRVATLDVGDAEPLDDQAAGGVGSRREPTPTGVEEGGDGVVAGGELGQVGAGGVGR